MAHSPRICDEYLFSPSAAACLFRYGRWHSVSGGFGESSRDCRWTVKASKQAQQSPKESSLIVGHCTANNTYSAHVVVFNGTMNPTNAIQCDDDGDKYTNCSSGFQVSPAPYYVRGVERIMQFAVNNETRCTRDGNCQLQIPAGCPNKLNMYSWHVSPSNLVISYSFLEYSGFSFGRHSWCQTNNEVSTATGIVPVDPSVVHATVNKYITLISKIPMCKE